MEENISINTSLSKVQDNHKRLMKNLIEAMMGE